MNLETYEKAKEIKRRIESAELFVKYIDEDDNFELQVKFKKERQGRSYNADYMGHDTWIGDILQKHLPQIKQEIRERYEAMKREFEEL